MGQTASSIVKGVVDDFGIDENPEKKQEVEDGIMQLKEITELKLEAFYQEKLLEATGKENTRTIPICSVVSKKQSVYSVKQDVIQNTLLKTIAGVVEDALESQWKRSISKLIQGGLESFFGPSEISTTGEMKETKIYDIVWSNNTMVRLDIFVTKTSLDQTFSLERRESEIFGGYIMVMSVVDLAKVNWQVFLFSFSKFFAKIKEEERNAADKLLDNIEEIASLLDATGKLISEARDVKMEATNIANTESFYRRSANQLRQQENVRK